MADLSINVSHGLDQGHAFETAHQQDHHHQHQHQQEEELLLWHDKRKEKPLPGIQLLDPLTKELSSIPCKRSQAHNPPQLLPRQRSSQSKKEKEVEDIEEKVSHSESGEYRNGTMRGHWRPAEDQKLREIVALYGPHNWNSIARYLHPRSGKSCRLRWFNQLDPNINHCPFSIEEEERLIASHRIYGSKWAMIARLFPGRTDNAVKNQWHIIIARKCRQIFKPNLPARRLTSTLTQHVLGNSPFDSQSFVPTPRPWLMASNNPFHHSYNNTNTNSKFMGAVLHHDYFDPHHHHLKLSLEPRKDRENNCNSSNCKTQSLPSFHSEHEDHNLANLPFIDFMGVSTHVSSSDSATTSSTCHNQSLNGQVKAPSLDTSID